MSTVEVAPVPASEDLASIAARIATDVAAPAADDVDRAARFPSETFDALRQERMLSALIPTEHGGAGARLTDVALAIEQLGAACASSAMVYAMHQIQVACLVRHGTTPWLTEYTRTTAAGELLLSSATTEVGIGGDVRSSSCAVETTGDRFALRKQAPVISYGSQSDAILVTARRGPDSPANDQSIAVVPNVEGTLDIRNEWNALGFRGTCSEGFLLEAEGDVEQIFPTPYADISAQTMLPTSHLLWSSVWLGIATSAVDKARALVRRDARKSVGSTPQAAVHLANLVAVLEQFRALVHTAAADYESVSDDVEALSSIGFALRMNSLKVSSSTLVVDVVGQAMSICGMAGYKEDSQFSLGRSLRDAYGAALMVNNDRLLNASAQMLLVHKGS